MSTVESRFLKASVSRSLRYLEPNLVFIEFVSLRIYISNMRLLETPDNSNQFWLPFLRSGFYTVNFLCFRENRINMQAVPTDEATRKSGHKFWRIESAIFVSDAYYINVCNVNLIIFS